MDFKTRRIGKREHSNTPPYLNKIKSNPELKAHLITIGGGLLLILILVFIGFQVIRSLDFSSIIFSFGQKLQTAPSGRTNILLAGIGGDKHDGGNLTDTVMVASIDYDQKLVPMVSIPRDLYVKTSQTGKSKLNEVFWLAKKQYGKQQGLYVLKEVASEILGQDIQYYVKVDFDGFVKIVDALGGVDVDVEKDIYDVEYPLGETINYTTFSLKKGLRHLDGATALKYARSRHGKGNERGDFDRARRQQILLNAIKEKAFSLNILTDPGKIKAIYDSVSESIDTNLTLGEIIEMAKIAKDFNKDAIFSTVLNDDPTECGGYVYTPAREYFDNASVMLPASNKYDYIHDFTNFVFNNTSAIKKAEGIQILNGTKTPGLAYEVFGVLSRYCMSTVYYGNAENRDQEKTTIYYKPGPKGEKPLILDQLTKLIPAQLVEDIPAEMMTSERRQQASIAIVLGRDYLSHQLPNPFDSLKYLYAPASTTQQNQNSTQTSKPATTN